MKLGDLLVEGFDIGKLETADSELLRHLSTMHDLTYNNVPLTSMCKYE